MSLPAYLFGGLAAALSLHAAISAHQSWRLWRRRRAFRRLAEQIRRCAALHPIPTARIGQNSGE